MKSHEFITENMRHLDEKWSQKYKSSINCSHPKGFSQKAHCAGKRKRNESIDEEMTCPDCGMCQTHRDHKNLDEACWKGYHKEGNKKMFGKTYPNCVKNTNEDATDAEKSQPNILDLLRSWRNRVPAQYAWHLTKTFGDPHDATKDIAMWHDLDGFKRIEIKDEYVMHISPSPHYDYCYSYIDLRVPHRLSSALADCSESILIDHLKNEVGARCASLAANAVTLNFVMDVVAGRTSPSRDEYEQRIMSMHDDFENGKIFTIEWWPDQSHDTDPANTYYRKQRKSKVQDNSQSFKPNVTENKRIPRKAGQSANSKKHSDLYTDENPNGTITGLKFATEGDARASVLKIRNSGRSHAHKIQAAVAMEQRAKAAGKSEAAAVYRKYINATKKTDESIDLEEACWDTHKQIGMKNKGGRMVPDCVPKESITEDLDSDQQFDLIEEMVMELAEAHGVDADVIWEDFESVDDHELFETAAWRRSAGKSKKGGLNAKGVASYRRENPGSKLQMAVTTKPSKLKPGSKAAKRRKSFCARMGGVKGPMKKPNGKPTRKALALRKWNC